MIQPGRRSLFLISLIGTLALALGVLATLEYRWAGIIREASRDRMQAELHTAVSHIQAEFDREIRNLCHSLDPASLPLKDVNTPGTSLFGGNNRHIPKLSRMYMRLRSRRTTGEFCSGTRLQTRLRLRYTQSAWQHYWRG